MILQHLRFAGFRSYRNEQSFDFSELCPALFFVGGDNQVEPRLGANSCGKSSLFDSICWCFYGKTARGLFGPKVLTWGESEGFAQVTFERNGHIYKVLRSINPNKLTLQDGKQRAHVVVQDDINEAIGLNYECFLSAALLGQFNRYFFDLSPTEKLTLLSFVLDLDGWVERSKRAKDDANLIEQELTRIDRHYAGLRGRLKELIKREKELQKSVLSEKKDTKQKEVELQLKLDKKEGKQTRLRRDIKVFEKQEQCCLAEAKKLEEQAAVIEQELMGLQKKQRAMDNELIKLEEREQTLRAEKKEIRDSFPNCSKCKQLVTSIHVREEAKKCRARIEAVVQKYDKCKELRECVRRQVAKLSSRLEKLEQRSSNSKAQAAEAVSEQRALDGQLNNNVQYMRMLTLDLEALQKGESPYQKQLDSTQADLATLREEKTAERHTLEDLKNKLGQAQFWVKGFKDLRLWLVNEVLRELEVEVNNSLVSLGLDGWEVTFDVERETKKGNVSRGLQVFVTPPGGKEPVPWECWAGGETQRLRVAGAAGISNLISRRRGVDLQFEIWDEPTAHMSKEGVDDLVRFFQERATLENKQVYLVDHRAIHFGEFDGVYRVVKDANGSRVQA